MASLSVKLLTLSIYLISVVYRLPQLVYPGRFWAEEGTVYFYGAYSTHPLVYLITPSLGYYSLYNKVAAMAAVYLGPLELAPVITGLMALVVQLIPAALLIFCQSQAFNGWPYKIVGLLLILFVQPNQEIWINTISSQFHFCVATGIILITTTQNPRGHIVRLIILLVAGMTGVTSCLLLPFFAIDYLLTRSNQRLHEVLVLTFACSVQLVAVFIAEGRETHAYWHIIPIALLIKQWILPLTGLSLTEDFLRSIGDPRAFQTSLSVVVVILYATFLLCLVLYGRKEALMLFLAALFVSAVSVVQSVESQGPELMMIHLTPLGAQRYYYAPNVFLALSLLLPVRKNPFVSLGRTSWRLLSLTMVVACLSVGILDFVTSPQRHPWFFSGPDWRSEVAAWRTQDSQSLQIWPRPWSMSLPGHVNR